MRLEISIHYLAFKKCHLAGLLATITHFFVNID